jgi:hypothetical protein
MRRRHIAMVAATALREMEKNSRDALNEAIGYYPQNEVHRWH